MGNKTTPQTSTTTQRTDIPAWVEQSSQSNINYANALPDFTPFTGQGVANLSPEQLRAIQMAGGNIGQGQGLLQPGIAGANNLSNFQAPMITGESVASQMPGLLNPFTQNVVDASNKEIDRSKTLQLQQNGATQARAGAFGGDRAAVMDGMTNRDMEDIRAKTNAGLYSSAYDKAMGTMAGNQNAAISGAGVQLGGLNSLSNMAGQFQNMGMQDMQGLLTAGGLTQGNDQQKKTFDFNEFLRQQQQPYQKLGAMTSATSGAKYDTNTTGTQTQQMNSNPLAGLLGLGMSFMGMPGAGAAMGGLGGLLGLGGGGGSGSPMAWAASPNGPGTYSPMYT